MAQRLRPNVKRVDNKARFLPGTVVGPDENGEKFVYARYVGWNTTPRQWVYPATSQPGFLDLGSFAVTTSRAGNGTSAAVPPVGQTVTAVKTGQYTWIKIAGPVYGVTQYGTTKGLPVAMQQTGYYVDSNLAVTSGQPIIGVSLWNQNANATAYIRLDIQHLPFH